MDFYHVTASALLDLCRAHDALLRRRGEEEMKTGSRIEYWENVSLQTSYART